MYVLIFSILHTWKHTLHFICSAWRWEILIEIALYVEVMKKQPKLKMKWGDYGNSLSEKYLQKWIVTRNFLMVSVRSQKNITGNWTPWLSWRLLLLSHWKASVRSPGGAVHTVAAPLQGHWFLSELRSIVHNLTRLASIMAFSSRTTVLWAWGG